MSEHHFDDDHEQKEDVNICSKGGKRTGEVASRTRKERQLLPLRLHPPTFHYSHISLDIFVNPLYFFIFHLPYLIIIRHHLVILPLCSRNLSHLLNTSEQS